GTAAYTRLSTARGSHASRLLRRRIPCRKRESPCPRDPAPSNDPLPPEAHERRAARGPGRRLVPPGRGPPPPRRRPRAPPRRPARPPRPPGGPRRPARPAPRAPAPSRRAGHSRHSADDQVRHLVEQRRAKLSLDDGAFTIEASPDSLRQRILRGEVGKVQSLA